MIEERKERAAEWREIYEARIRHGKETIAAIDAWESGLAVQFRDRDTGEWKEDLDFDPDEYESLEYRPAPTVNTVFTNNGPMICLTDDIRESLAACGYQFSK